MSEDAKKKESSEGDKKKKKIIIVVVSILVVIIIALVVVVACLLGKKKNDDDDKPDDGKRRVEGSVRTVLEESDADDVMGKMKEEVAEGMFECKMSMEWTFVDGNSESKDAYIANSTNNTHPIYFDIYMKDTEELVYSSPVIPVGGEVKNIKLGKKLEKGEYKATVMYTLLKDAESQEEISSAGFVVKINVLN
ncbi:MAG: hypothetical protein K6G26_10520 [Lachnospiraceae bacterium]|nr:hypothetical protein [Lachnospiraceae bacterium]